MSDDLISRQEAIRLAHSVLYEMMVDAATTDIEKPMSKEDKLLLRVNKVVCTKLKELPSAEPDNQINLCDSCDYSYPDCQSKNDDVIFGNGIGNDNICACNKYKPSAYSRTKGKWIAQNPFVDTEECSVCGYNIQSAELETPFCPWCGARMSEGEEEGREG